MFIEKSLATLLELRRSDIHYYYTHFAPLGLYIFAKIDPFSYCKNHNYLHTTNQRQMRVKHSSKSTLNTPIVFSGFGFPPNAMNSYR